MKKITNQIGYKCEVCGCIYDEEEKAHKCEDSHVLQLPMAKMLDTDLPGTYPQFITMKFFDGKLLIYRILK